MAIQLAEEAYKWWLEKNEREREAFVKHYQKLKMSSWNELKAEP